MCPCALVTVIGKVRYWLTVYCMWCVSMQILYNYRYICITVQCSIISIHLPSYNIARHGLLLTMLCLSNEFVSLTV